MKTLILTLTNGREMLRMKNFLKLQDRLNRSVYHCMEKDGEIKDKINVEFYKY